MGKRITARLDHLIDALLADARFDVRRDGSILKNGTPIGFTREKGEGKHRGKTYRYVSYKGKCLKVHRIVYQKFHGGLDDQMVVHHIDGDPMNNTPDNLELVTQELNQIYKKVS